MSPYKDTSPARVRFKIGDRVKLSAHGLTWLVSVRRNAKRAYSRDTRGTVVGYGRSPQLLGVLRDGTKAREAYHVDMWELAE